jgi:hypothetical protein
MKSRIALLVVCLCCAAAQQQIDPSQTTHIKNNVVFMFPGDKFGLDLGESAGTAALNISEEPNLEKASVVLGFKQEKGMMLLTIENRTGHWLTYEAGIRVPKHDRVLQDQRGAHWTAPE